jgi:hypothetical protein
MCPLTILLSPPHISLWYQNPVFIHQLSYTLTPRLLNILFPSYKNSNTQFIFIQTMHLHPGYALYYCLSTTQINSLHIYYLYNKPLLVWNFLTGLNTQESTIGVNPSEEIQIDSPLFGMEEPSGLMARQPFDEL